MPYMEKRKDGWLWEQLIELGALRATAGRDSEHEK